MYDGTGVRQNGTQQVVVPVIDTFNGGDTTSSSCSFYASVTGRDDANDTACASFASLGAQIGRTTLQTILSGGVQNGVLDDRATGCRVSATRASDTNSDSKSYCKS